MSRGKFWLVIFVLVVIALVAGCVFFTKTGGVGLSRVVWHYLFRDLPDKKYSWRDFTERGEGYGISGFYAWGNEQRFYLWTLSGLKQFEHVSGVSVYQHEDVCFAVKQLVSNPTNNNGVLADKTITGDLAVWRDMVKQENLVTVKQLSKAEYRNGVDKVWSYSGKYKELNKLDQESCK